MNFNQKLWETLSEQLKSQDSINVDYSPVYGIPPHKAQRCSPSASIRRWDQLATYYFNTDFSGKLVSGAKMFTFHCPEIFLISFLHRTGLIDDVPYDEEVEKNFFLKSIGSDYSGSNLFPTETIKLLNAMFPSACGQAARSLAAADTQATGEIKSGHSIGFQMLRDLIGIFFLRNLSKNWKKPLILS